MKRIELKILAEDINSSSYFNTTDCAISRSLKRAKINADDLGLRIRHENGEEIDQNRDLSNKVKQMYRYANPNEHPYTAIRIKPEDFTFFIEVPDNW